VGQDQQCQASEDQQAGGLPGQEGTQAHSDDAIEARPEQQSWLQAAAPTDLLHQGVLGLNCRQHHTKARLVFWVQVRAPPAPRRNDTTRARPWPAAAGIIAGPSA
jgi:hypothetical protein